MYSSIYDIVLYMVAIISIFGLSLVFGMTLFTWRVYTFFLKTSPLMTHWLLALALLVPILFVGGLIVIRTKLFTLPLWSYMFTNYLAGLGYYLFHSAIVLGIIGGVILFIQGVYLPLGIVYFFVALPIVLTITGFVQAKQIQITSYTVELPNFPASWNDKKVALVTDTHFGIVLQKKFADTVVDTILAQRPDIVLHGGDFYDGPTLDTAPITESWKKLTAQIPVFYAPGNHELYGDYKGFIQSIRDANITVLEDSKIIYEGVQIGGIVYHGKNDEKLAKESLAKVAFTKDAPAILINHPPTFIADATANGVDLMVSGHTHNGQFWPNTYIVRAIYGIYTYGLQKYENMFVLTSKGVGTAGPPLRLFNRPEVAIITIKTR